MFADASVHVLISELSEFGGHVERNFQHVPDAWIDHDRTKVGYEIPFNRFFYVYTPSRSLDEIDADLKVVTDRIKQMLEELE